MANNELNILTSDNNTVSVTTEDRVITIINDGDITNVTIPQSETSTISLLSFGPKGDKGETGDVGILNTASLATTGSNTFYGLQTIAGEYGTLVYGDYSTPGYDTLADIHAYNQTPWLERFYNDSFSTSSAVMAYFAWNDGRFIFHNESTQSISINVGSYDNNTGLSVYMDKVTFANNIEVAGGITGSLFGSASYSETASYALNAGAGAGFPYSGSAVITGSLVVVEGGITASIYGYVPNEATTSFIVNSQTSSFVLNTQTGSFATTASNIFIGDQTISGSIIFDEGARITSTYYGNTYDGAIDIVAGQNGFVELMSYNSQSYFWIDDYGAYLITSGSNYWEFNNSGVFTAPGRIVAPSFTGSFSGSVVGYVANTQTSSFVTNNQTASFVTNSQTSSFVQNSQTSSFVTNSQTSSFVQNSQTSSFVLNSQTASFVLNSVTSSMLQPYVLSTQTGSMTMQNLTVTGTASFNYLTVTYETASVIYSSGSNQFGDATNDIQTLIGTVIVSGSQRITGSLNVSGGITGSFSGSVVGYVPNTATASFILNSQTGSMLSPYVLNSQTSSFVTNSQTGSFVQNSQTASFATTGSNTFKGTQTISGSLIVTGSTTFSGSIGTTIFTSNADTLIITGSLITTGSVILTGSMTATGTISAATFSGTVLGYVANSQTSSFVLNTQTASFATTGSNSFRGNQTITGSATITGSVILTGSFTQNASTASFGGNVGIGTTSPESKLQVSGLTTITGQWNSASTINGLHLSFGHPTSGPNIGQIYSIQNGSTWRRLDVEGSPLVLNGQSGGNVGIGTTSPSYKLDVNGNTNINVGTTGYLRLQGNDKHTYLQSPYSNTVLLFNAKYVGGGSQFEYDQAGGAMYMNMQDGGIGFNVAPISTAGNAVSWTGSLSIGSNAVGTFYKGLIASGAVFLPQLTNTTQSNVVSVNTSTGQLYYQNTIPSASYALTASYAMNGGGGGTTAFNRNRTIENETSTIYQYESIFNHANLLILSSSIFIVEEDANYYVLGDLTNSGSLIVSGTLKIGGTLYNAGTITGTGIIE